MSNLSGPGAFSVRGDTLTAHNSLAPKFSALMLWFFYLFFFSSSSWQSRSDVLNYCAGVATSPDPDDPDHMLRETEDARARERIVDERLDPYSARYFPRDTRTESLAGLVRNERMVETIIRSRTWNLVGERCENETADADKALDDWRRRMGTSPDKSP